MDNPFVQGLAFVVGGLLVCVGTAIAFGLWVGVAIKIVRWFLN
jgi:hypothetical protein